jgi:hypothetical protein
MTRNVNGPNKKKKKIVTEKTDNVIELNIPTKEDIEAMELQEEIFEEFGNNGLFTVQMVSAVFGDLYEEIQELKDRVEALEGPSETL